MPEKLIVYVLCGAPGSGKTTWAKKRGLPVINIDRKRKRVLGTWALNASPEVKEKAFLLAVLHAKKLLKKRMSFVWDATNLKPDRIKLLHALGNPDVHFIAIAFTASLSDCLKRNRHRSGYVDESIVIDRYNKLEKDPPVREEGFADVIHV